MTNFEEEIAKRDARIAELEASKAAADDMFRSLGGEIYELNAKLAALKAQQPSVGVVVGALVSALEGIVHDERVPNEVSQDYAALLIEARRLNHCRAQAVQICKLGMYGQAYDTPGTYRAYTYADQPGNVIAHTLGGCLRAAHCDGGGDFIDFGLALLMRLQDRGFGVFQIAAAPSAKKESGDE